MSKNVLTEEQIKILTHLAYHAVGGQMCGCGAGMDELVEFGFIKELCSPPFLASSLYQITDTGRNTLRDIEWDSNKNVFTRLANFCGFRRKRGE